MSIATSFISFPDFTKKAAAPGFSSQGLLNTLNPLQLGLLGATAGGIAGAVNPGEDRSRFEGAARGAGLGGLGGMATGALVQGARPLFGSAPAGGATSPSMGNVRSLANLGPLSGASVGSAVGGLAGALNKDEDETTMGAMGRGAMTGGLVGGAAGLLAPQLRSAAGDISPRAGEWLKGASVLSFATPFSKTAALVPPGSPSRSTFVAKGKTQGTPVGNFLKNTGSYRGAVLGASLGGIANAALGKEEVDPRTGERSNGLFTRAMRGAGTGALLGGAAGHANQTLQANGLFTPNASKKTQITMASAPAVPAVKGKGTGYGALAPAGVPLSA